MPATTVITLLVESDGRVLGAELPGADSKAKDAKGPVAALVAQGGQRLVRAAVPPELLALTGPSLHQIFSEVRLGDDGQLHLPKIRVDRMHK
jgi:hypothetical protein